MGEFPVFHVIEFFGDRDPAMGGNAADLGLYRQEDGTHAFMSGMEALRRQLAHSYFPTRDEAQAAAEESTTRNGLLSVLEKRIDPKIPTGEIGWFVGNLHVGTSDEEVAGKIAAGLSRACDGDREILAQASAYALACHRANQGLVAAFRL